MNVKMPPLLLNSIIPCLVPSELDIVQSIMKNGRLRPARPKVEYEAVAYGNSGLTFKVPKEPSGSTAYLWAYLAYFISPYKRDLATPPDKRRYFSKENLKLADRLAEIGDLLYKSTPKEYRYGAMARGEDLNGQ